MTASFIYQYCNKCKTETNHSLKKGVVFCLKCNYETKLEKKNDN